MAQFNGHRSWNAWNVSLWINNDEDLYSIATECVTKLTPQGKKPTLGMAVRRFMESFEGEFTPDKARYNHKSVEAALKDLL